MRRTGRTFINMAWAIMVCLTAMACSDDVEGTSTPETPARDAGASQDTDAALDAAPDAATGDTAPAEDAQDTEAPEDEATDDAATLDADVSTDDVTLTDLPADAPEDVPEQDALEDAPEQDALEDAPEQDAFEDEPDVEDPPPVYLVNVGNNLNELRLYDVEQDRVVTACNFQDPVNYPSITFGLDGTLYGSRNGQFLDIIDPCDCTTTYVGDMGYDGIVGITANGVKEVELYGLSRIEDLLLTVDLEDGAGSPVGDGLGVDFGFSGSTWSSDIIGLYAIDSTTNTLFTIGTDTGLATDPVLLDTSFGTVGIEWHPFDRSLYACTDSAVYRVDPATGETTYLTRFQGGCNNLAAPWIRIQCLEDRLEP